MIVRNDPKTLRSGLVMRWARASTIEKAHQLLTWAWAIQTDFAGIWGAEVRSSSSLRERASRWCRKALSRIWQPANTF